MKYTGVTARGILSPVLKKGDDLVAVVCDSVMAAAEDEGFTLDNGDIIGVTESVLARTQGNYATVKQMAADVRAKFGGGTVGAVFPILSRNRFSVLLKAIAMGCDRLVVLLSYPADEVGNALFGPDMLEEKGVNPYADRFTEAEFRAVFGEETVHPFTGVDYVAYYKSFAPHIELVFANDPTAILQYTDKVLCCDIHSRERTRRKLLAAGAKTVYTLAELMNKSVKGSGYNEQYGVLGSNMATADSVKLFPRDCEQFVFNVQTEMHARTGHTLEVLVYGDGCFKDPVGGIWELADPVVSPAHTAGLAGTPNELKMKYFADNEFAGLAGAELTEAVRGRIREKQSHLVGSLAAQGTTPRRTIDLVGSLCDLVSGSGDRGTPIVHIKGYFTNYASE